MERRQQIKAGLLWVTTPGWVRNKRAVIVWVSPPVVTLLERPGGDSVDNVRTLAGKETA